MRGGKGSTSESRTLKQKLFLKKRVISPYNNIFPLIGSFSRSSMNKYDSKYGWEVGKAPQVRVLGGGGLRRALLGFWLSVQRQNNSLPVKGMEVGVHSCKRKQNWWHQPHATLIETKKSINQKPNIKLNSDRTIRFLTIKISKKISLNYILTNFFIRIF
jgi:hypothetical protein